MIKVMDTWVVQAGDWSACPVRWQQKIASTREEAIALGSSFREAGETTVLIHRPVRFPSYAAERAYSLCFSAFLIDGITQQQRKQYFRETYGQDPDVLREEQGFFSFDCGASLE